MSKKHYHKRKHHFLRGEREGPFHGFNAKDPVRIGINHCLAGWCGKIVCFCDGLIWVDLNKPPANVGNVDGKLFLGIEPYKLVHLS